MSQELKPYTVCFTGHRKICHENIPEKLDVLLLDLIRDGYIYFGVGGALGFDTLAALAVLRARKHHPHIKLIIVAPYPAQDERWNSAQQGQYRDIIAQANKVRYTSDKYMRDCYHVRNRWLVDCTGLCVAYQYKNSGGTAFTVRYAREQGVHVINIVNSQDSKSHP